MKKAAILIMGIFIVVICFSLVSCQKKETETVSEPVGTVEKAAPEAGGYGEKAKEAVSGYGEKAKKAVSGYGEKAEEAVPGYGK